MPAIGPGPSFPPGFRPGSKASSRIIFLGIVGAVPGQEAEQLYKDLQSRAAGDELAAYFFLPLKCPHKSPYDKFDDVDAIKAAHPGSA